MELKCALPPPPNGGGEHSPRVLKWPPPPAAGGGGGGGGELNLLINSQKGEGLTGPQMLGRGCWERGGEFSKKEGVVFWSGEG